MSFNKEDVVNCFRNTLSNEQVTRQRAEQTLLRNLSEADFLNFLLNLSVDEGVESWIRLSAVIFVKNSVVKYWLKRNQQVSKVIANVEINAKDKVMIKSSLVNVITQGLGNQSVVSNLMSLLSCFLNSGENDNNVYGTELLMVVEKLMKSAETSAETSTEHLTAALLILYELTKYYRWSIQGFNISLTSTLNQADQINDSINLLNKLAKYVFPILLNLSSTILCNLSAGSLAEGHSDRQFYLLYLVLKIFKYTIFNDLPEYLLAYENDKYVNLDDWVQLQFAVLQLEFAQNYSEAKDRKDYGVHCQKWAVSNLVRLYFKYGGGNNGRIDVNNYDINVEQHTEALKHFQTFFHHRYLAQYFEHFFVQIDKWHNQKSRLFDPTIYYLIKFFSYSLNNPSTFNSYLLANLHSLIQYLIFPSIVIRQDSLELFYEDEEEFFRKMYDSSADDHRIDSAAVNFLYKLSNSYFDAVIDWLFGYLNRRFEQRQQCRTLAKTGSPGAPGAPGSSEDTGLENALQTEASLRVVGVLSYHLVSKESSPVRSQIDALIHSYIAPELFDHQYLFLTTRALETLATFHYKFQDLGVLSEVFKGVVGLLETGLVGEPGDKTESETEAGRPGRPGGPGRALSDSFLVQVQALDALRSLLINKDIHEYLKASINKIISKLLALITEYEIDLLTTILEEFIAAFSSELKPVATELSLKLCSQLAKIARELLDMSANRADAGAGAAENTANMESLVSYTAAEDDKELQCIGVINNLSVMVENMASDKVLLVNISMTFDPCVKFVIHNSMLGLLDEAMGLSTLLLRSLGRVTRSIQNSFDHILDVFHTVGYDEYYDYFNNFFEAFVVYNYNFKYYWETQFNKQLAAEFGRSSVDLQLVQTELKNTLDIGFFTLDSDHRLLALVKLNHQVLNCSILDCNYKNISACFTLYEDIVLSVLNASFYLQLLENPSNAAQCILSFSSRNDSNVLDNLVLQSIVETCVNAFLNSLFVNLEEIVLLTEEHADMSYVDIELVYVVNNFVKLLLSCFFYKPSLVIHVINHFDKIDNLLDLLTKIDDTNSTQVDELSLVPLESNILFFQLLNKLWLSFNSNNSFAKMEKPSKFGVKLQILVALKLIRNEALLKNMFKSQNSSKYLDLWLQKLHVKLLDLVAQIPALLEAELKSAPQEPSANIAPAAPAADDDDDFSSDLFEDDLDVADNYNYNEKQRLKLLDFKNYNLPNPVSFHVVKEYISIYDKEASANGQTFAIINSYVLSKNLGDAIQKAVQIDNQCLLEDF